ncbi:DUF3857 domain-containing protein [Pontibacter sp. 172403-2]|uniref:DUF3857 domain-containing protein n=1 Tax=Pontibacter rufus TaxID=2791028 RepID=UPI0018AFF3A1|nr:DUF3857 domain-containing protein [Pontibacter sp. 172403-2]MBF9252025.1 DUF3857 domain-containing protein [Pontibacter sp. 172403-2]
MRTLTSTLTLFLLFACAVGASRVQGQAAKFGKISDEELKMRVYEKDTSAAAVILSDVGYSHFQYSDGFKLVFEREMRIKILKKSGYNWADIEVPYYERGSDRENVTSIRGYTYNLVDGKVQKDKLESKAVFDEQMTENWSAKKFTMPNVKEGSVIDVKYTIYSDFFQNMREWEFQKTIPVAWSEYKVQIPEYFDYKLLQQGYLPFYNSTSSKTQDSFNVKRSGSTEGGGFNTRREPASVDKVDAPSSANSWAMKDVPALRPEKYITTLSDYQAKIEFELQKVQFPGQSAQIVVGEWEQVTRDLLEEEKFGVQLNRNGFFKEELAALMAKYKTPESQMEAIHSLVKNRVEWDGKYGKFAMTPIRKVYDNKKGSAAEINLLMTSMLLEAGLDAAPVLLSTRENGRVYKGSPMLSKFNYVISHVRIGDTEYLLDATEPLLAAGNLPVRCLNGEGRLIKKDDQRWVALKPAFIYSKLFSGNISISSNGDMKGTATESIGGYNALYTRKSILEDGEDKFLESFAKETGDMKILKPKIKNLNDEAHPLDITYEIAASGSGQENSVIYLDPMLGRGEKENPFKLEERAYPVDFAAPQDETYICNFTLPEGYEMEEVPQSKVLSMPDNGGKFMYVVKQEGNVVQIMSKVNINKPVFYAPEYAYLKEFFNQIITKQSEQIVLKKVTAGNTQQEQAAGNAGK